MLTKIKNARLYLCTLFNLALKNYPDYQADISFRISARMTLARFYLEHATDILISRDFNVNILAIKNSIIKCNVM